MSWEPPASGRLSCQAGFVRRWRRPSHSRKMYDMARDDVGVGSVQFSTENPLPCEGQGRVVCASSMADVTVRRAFCGLLGSKYAAVIAGGRMMSDLIQMSTAIVKVHREMSESDRVEVLNALRDCSTANEPRNRFIHDQLAYLDDRVIQVRSQRLRYDDQLSFASIDDIRNAAESITQASGRLVGKIVGALGDEAWYRTFEMQFEDARSEQVDVESSSGH